MIARLVCPRHLRYLTFTALCVLSLAFAIPAGATEILPGGASVLLPANRVLEDDTVAMGSDVQALGTVKGDLIAVGGTVSVSGEVQGDVLAAGGTLLLHGPVTDDVRATGGTVILSGPVKDNVLLAGGTVSLEPSAPVGRDAMIAGSVVRVSGPVKRDLRIAAGEATVASDIGGSLRAEVGRLSLAPGAVVHGDLTVVSERPPEIAPGAKVIGRVKHLLPNQATPAPRGGGPATGFVSWLMGWAVRFLALLVLGGIALSMAPSGTGRLEGTLRSYPGQALLAGLVTLIVVPIAVVILMMTIVGIPAALALLLLYGAVLLEAGVTTACYVGRWLRQRVGRPEGIPYARLAWGALALSLAASLPWIGGTVTLLAVIGGLGALVLDRGRPLFTVGRTTAPTAPPNI